METEKEAYIKEMTKKYSRAELLAACRSIGLTAHQIKDNKKLAELLYEAKQRFGN